MKAYPVCVCVCMMGGGLNILLLQKYSASDYLEKTW